MKRKIFFFNLILLIIVLVLTTIAALSDPAMKKLPLYLGLYIGGVFLTTMNTMAYLILHLKDEDFYTNQTIYQVVAACILMLLYGTALAYLALRYGIKG